MAMHNRLDALCAAAAGASQARRETEASFEPNDFEAELNRLAQANQQLFADLHMNEEASTCALLDAPGSAETEELELLRRENAELKVRVEELEAHTGGESEEAWPERQREYEALLEEKSEVIRSLHQKLQEMQEAGAGAPKAQSGAVPLGQAEEILRLKRELEEQRKQLERDEEDMMTQMRQMELTMGKERAEMARQRAEVQRLQAQITRETENASRDPDLQERLRSLRRGPDPKKTPSAEKDAPPQGQNTGGFLSRIFG